MPEETPESVKKHSLQLTVSHYRA